MELLEVFADVTLVRLYCPKYLNVTDIPFLLTPVRGNKVNEYLLFYVQNGTKVT
jgi:hypothetical protein